MHRSFSLHNILIADYMPLSFKQFFSKPCILPTVMLSKFHNPYFPINTICVAHCNSLDLWFFNVWTAHTRALMGLFQDPAYRNGFAECLVPPDDASLPRLSPSLWDTHLSLLWGRKREFLYSGWVYSSSLSRGFHEFRVWDGPHIWKSESHPCLDFVIVTAPRQSRSSSLCSTPNIPNYHPSPRKILDSARVFVSRRSDKCNRVVQSIS